jgi:uncharacterized protein (TIGR02996 family)
MTSTRQALFQAICEQPWDTSLRLTYADWLEKNGQPQWAAFIRAQCQNPGRSLDSFQALCSINKDRGEFDPFESDWLKELPKLPGVWWGDGFERGFINHVTFHSAKAFQEHAATVFAAAPIDSSAIERLTDETIPDVLSSPFLRRLQWLALYSVGRLTEVGMRLLAACPNLTYLENLSIESNGCGDEGAEALAGSPYLGKLQRLYLENHQIGDRGALALARSPNLSNVTFLVFRKMKRLSQPVVAELKKRFQWLDGWPTQD